uniref:Enoyl reductase (ER) domain-containing protein n=1 Tax=Lotharella globosa TaxID=91324 RepID=A0A7S3Z917_9EUKA
MNSQNPRNHRSESEHPKHTMMKAIVVKEYKEWKSQNLEPVEVDKPTAGAGQVLIKAKAAAVNPIDWMVMAGFLKGAGWAQPAPYIPGYDVAGVVEAVGEGVTDFKAGDEVFSVNWSLDVGQQMGRHDDNAGEQKKGPIAGTFAEYCVLPANKVSKKPSKLSFEEAAGVALVGTTAYQSLKTLGVEKGKKVLILGAAGAVGNLACQLAKSMGAYVATTASSRTMEYVKPLGVDKIINYREEKWEECSDLKDIDAVLDTVGEKEGFERAKKIVKEGGSFISISSGDVGYVPTAHKGFKYASFYVLKNNVKDQDTLAGMVADGKLKLKVEKTFPFTKQGVTDAFTAQTSGKSMGKNVIVF